ncbi:MAG: isoprenylcysteine carboxylmethyltransferase family protein [Synergistaceae bacterium]|jgi:protein-S-isoprenylcysteine O-methyltransferase Ste14|nr:isoprenylcysteine carboxylmethyltransferase family protein [Synergistaceae bacterium]
MTEILFKYRGLVWGLFALAVLIFPVYPSTSRLIAGVPLVAAGQLLRFWAAGVIPKYRTLVVGAPELIKWGPYAWMRNPLYAGNGIMGLGWALMAGWAWEAAFAAVYTALYVLTIIPHEEKFLQDRFGGEYIQYKKTTPSLFPALNGFGDRIARSAEGFDAKKSWFMERHSLRMNIAVTALVLARLYYVSG